ncbi:MAG TPA: hypothetical protein VL400_17355 [Polyangiaceae bacterium]|nr:hypothetical protein [Polyangiaceae bacterium]
MSTPKLKLLLQALRLGQPQDPQIAIAALAEAIAAQEATIDDLRSKLAVVTSRAQILDAKVALLTSDLEEARAEIDAAPPSEGYGSQRHDSWGPPPLGDAHAALKHESLAPPPLPQIAPGAHADAHAREASPPTRKPPSIAPPAPPPPIPDVSARQMHDAESSDDFSIQTAVISRRDAERLRVPEAPFRIAPPGARNAPAPQASIPGAPWARGRNAAAPMPTDEFTVDAPEQHGDEGATYDDSGFEAQTRVARPDADPRDGRVDTREPGPQNAGAPQRPSRPPPHRSS